MFLWYLRKLSYTALFLSLGLMLFFLAALPAHAAPHVTSADPISMTAQTATINFPKSIDFQANASDTAGLITRATLYIDYGPQRSTQPYMATIATPAHQVTVKWHQDTNNYIKYVAPGAKISYYWQLTDNVGTSHMEQKQIITINDTRFNWQHAEQGNIQINWYQRPASFGQVLLAKANDAMTHITNKLGAGLRHPVQLWLYQTHEDWRGSLSADEADWSGGITFPEYNVTTFVVDSANDDADLMGTMPHEMTHLVFHQLIENGIYPPIWFDEGMAVYNELVSEPELDYRFRQAVSKNALLPLRQFTRSYPSDTDTVDLAYGESWKLLDYMYKTFGTPKMVAFIKAMDNPSHTFDEDLQQTLGLDTDHLENQWHISLGLPPTAQSTPTVVVTPAPTPVPPPVAQDDNAGLTLLIVGLLLVIIPVLSAGGLFFYVQHTRARERTVQQAQQIMNRNMQQARQPVYPPYVNYAHPMPQAQPPRHAPFPMAPGPYAAPGTSAVVPGWGGGGQSGSGNVPVTPRWQGTAVENPYSSQPGFQEYATPQNKKEVAQE